MRATLHGFASPRLAHLVCVTLTLVALALTVLATAASPALAMETIPPTRPRSELSGSARIRPVACSPGMYTDIEPCSGSTTAPPNSTSQTITFRIHNSSSWEADYELHCSHTGPVTNCSVPSQLLRVTSGSSSEEVTLTYWTGSTSGDGSVTITATDTYFLGSNDHAEATMTITVSAPTHTVEVTPDGATAPTRASNTGGYSASFTVTNTGTATSSTYGITCAGSTNVTCNGTSVTSVTLAKGADTTLTASYSVGAAGTGTLSLTASGTNASNGGSYTVPVAAYPVIASATEAPSSGTTVISSASFAFPVTEKQADGSWPQVGTITGQRLTVPVGDAVTFTVGATDTRGLSDVTWDVYNPSGTYVVTYETALNGTSGTASISRQLPTSGTWSVHAHVINSDGNTRAVIFSAIAKDRPTVTITEGLRSGSTQRLTIDWGSNGELDDLTRQITFNGTDVTAAFTYRPNTEDSAPSWRSEGQVTLQAGQNTLVARICNTDGACGNGSWSYSADIVAPTISMAPSGGYFTSRTVPLTITWCDDGDSGLNPARMSVMRYWEEPIDNDITDEFDYVVTSGGCATSSGILTLDSDSTRLVAEICDMEGNCSTRDTDFLLVQEAVSVTPDGETTSMMWSTSEGHTATFTVTNPGLATSTYALTCEGSTNVTCSGLSDTTVTVAGSGGSTLVTATYSVGDQGTGTLSLTATGTTASDTGSYNVPVLACPVNVAVIPDAQAVRSTTNSSDTVGFTIRSVGDSADTYLLSAMCTGQAFTTTASCSLSEDSVILGPDESALVAVVYQTGSTADWSGTIMLRAIPRQNLNAKDSAFVDVRLVNRPSPGVAFINVSPYGAQLERSPCLTIRLTESAAYECGDIRAVHALPAVRTFNKARIPFLIYNSQVAHPHPMLAANVTLDPAWGTPDSVIAELKRGTATLGTGRWSGAAFANGATRRIVVGFDAATTFTDFAVLNVTAKHLATGAMHPLSASWALSAVDRSQSPFGRGWAVAGVERLRFVSLGGMNCIWWEAGDGGNRLYLPVPEHPTTWWVGQSLDRPDTIKFNPSEQYYLRYAEHGAKVKFNVAGQHIATKDRLGDSTVFSWSDTTQAARLETIVVPSPGETHVAYEFHYYESATGDTLIDYISAPGPDADGPRREVHFSVNALGELESITDPDTNSVGFTYHASRPGVVESVTERGGATTSFSFDDGQKLTGASTAMGEDEAPITIAFASQETRGLEEPVPTDSAYTLVNGPRTDTTVTKFWLDAYGEPVRVKDALGYETTYERSDGRWPTLVTRVRYANGRVVGAKYDARGNIATTTDSSSFKVGTSGDTVFATTTYLWDGKYDFVTQATLPDGEIAKFGIHPDNGNRLWQEDGRGLLSRVSFHYYDAGTNVGLLRATELPGGATYSVAYDALGNLNYSETPLHYGTHYENDDIGRTVVIRQPIDGTSTQNDSLKYDLMDRVVRQVAYGPALNTGTTDSVPEQKLVVLKYYNPSGVLDSLYRVSEPDPAGIDTIKTQWLYDLAMRAIQEIAPDDERDSTVYDPAGNPIEHYTRRRDASGNRYMLGMTYNALNRLSTRSVPSVTYEDTLAGIGARENRPYPRRPTGTDSNYVIDAQTESFTYDKGGRILTANNGDARVTRSYYTNGALKSERQQLRDAKGTSFSHDYLLQYTYDLSGHRTVVKLPSQLVPAGTRDSIAWSYAPQTGELTQVTDPLGNAFEYGYNYRGEPVSLDYPGGYTEHWGYDDDGRIAGDTILNLDGTGGSRLPASVLRAATFSYDQRGKLLESYDSRGYQLDFAASYTGLGALARSHTTENGQLSGAPSIEESYVTDEQQSYDALGNIFASSTVDTLKFVGTSQFQSHFRLRDAGYQAGVGRLRAEWIGNDFKWYGYDQAGNLKFSVLDPGATGQAEDRFSYYGADDKLRAADHRVVPSVGITIDTTGMPEKFVFEEYRYDALGRRVWVRTYREMFADLGSGAANLEASTSTLRRTIWDGDQELIEIQVPGAETDVAATLESDDSLFHRLRDKGNNDPNPFFGRVVYIHGLGLDRPIAVTRYRYVDYYQPNPSYTDFPPKTNSLFWTAVGQLGLAACADGSQFCSHNGYIMGLEYPKAVFAYDRPKFIRQVFQGTLLADKEDGAGTLYRRNRVYDPSTGRFTQEDPIGLAGGMNLYGFAAGDPVSYSDPFGLKPCKDAQGNPVDCPEPAGGPPVPLPDGRKWVPAGGGSTPDKSGKTRGRRWVPSTPLPGGVPQPGGSWDPELGHWDVDNLPGSVPGRKGRRRFDGNGQEVTHDGDPVFGPQQFPQPNSNKVREAAGLGLTYWIISELSRLIPVRNLIPVP